MGFRFRKSVSFFGGAFRVNFSKSGIGYSYGVKGARITHTATGRKRATLSIPGTGISYVTESGKRKVGNSDHSANLNSYPNDQILYRTIENESPEGLISVEEKEFINRIKRYRIINRLLSWIAPIWMVLTITLFSSRDYYDYMVLLSVALLILMFIYKFAAKVKISYSFDDYGMQKKQLITQVMTKLKSNAIIWQVNNIYLNQNTKVYAGAGRSLSTKPINVKEKCPSFLKTDVTVYEVKLTKEKLYVFPDKLLVVKGNKIGSIHTKDLDIHFSNTRFITDFAPNDARVIDYTWRYVNKNGGPDKRFNNNSRLPICDVGTMSIKATQGLNVLLYFSNVYTIQTVSNLLVENQNLSNFKENNEHYDSRDNVHPQDKSEKEKVAFAKRPEEKDKWVAFLLCLFLGPLGAHKFYEKKIALGVLYLFTYGLFGIGTIVDLVKILLKEERFYKLC